MVGKFRGKIERPKLSDVLEEAPLKGRILRGLLLLGTGVATIYVFTKAAQNKPEDDVYNSGMERYYESIKARDEFIASIIRENSETKPRLDGQKSDSQR